MLTNFPDEKYISDRNSSFIKRVYFLRQIGVVLCFLPIYSVLQEQSHHKITIALLILNALTWPSVAYLASMMSKDMLSAEKKNMILDSFWAGVWIAVMQVSPIPSLFIISVQIADRYAAGGWKILKPALMWMMIGFLTVWLANDFKYTIEFSTPNGIAFFTLGDLLSHSTEYCFKALIYKVEEKKGVTGKTGSDGSWLRSAQSPFF